LFDFLSFSEKGREESNNLFGFSEIFYRRAERESYELFDVPRVFFQRRAEGE